MEVNDSQFLKKWIWAAGLTSVFLFIAWRLDNVAILVLLSSLVAYIINPLVTRLASMPFLGRSSATVIALLGLSIGFFTVMFFLVPNVAKEFLTFYERLPELVNKLYSVASIFAHRYFDLEIPETWNDMFAQVYGQIRIHGDLIFRPVAEVTRTIFGTTFRALFFLASIFMFPLFIFFLLKDFPRIIKAIDDLVPLRSRETARQLARDIDASLSAFLHGQFAVMIVLGILYAAGYYIVGIPLALGVGLFTGLLCFVPYLGAATGFVLALLMAVFSFKGWYPVWGVTIVFASVQALDAAVITPRILGGKLGLQPLWIIIALMAGGELFGFLGVLLAVPSVAVLKVVVKFSIDSYKKSEMYNTGVQDIVVQPEEEQQGR